MAIGIRDLKNRAPEIIRHLGRKGSVVVTKHGTPTALILAIETPEAEDYILSHAPEIVRSLRDADRDLRNRKTVRLSTYRRRRGI